MKATQYFVRSLSITLPLLFALVWLPSQVAAQSYVTNEGHKIEIRLSPDKETIMLGEPTYLSFEVRNLSDQDLYTTDGGDYRNALGRPNSFKVTVVRDDGKTVTQPDAGWMGGGLLGQPEIPANGSYVKKLFLPHWATFQDTGTYIISVKKTVVITNLSTESSTSIDADVSAKIKLVSTDTEKLGELIDSLGKRMLDANYDDSLRAASELNSINDERVIKYFAQSLDGTAQRSVKFTAALALARFKDDAALAALKRSSGEPDNDIRNAIASALARSAHPQAQEHLLTMRKDVFYGVRLTVLHALGKMCSAESLVMIQEMTMDENQQVRDEAIRYLRERASGEAPR